MREVTAAELAQPLTNFEQARNIVLSSVTALDIVDVPLAEAVGLVVAQDVHASMNVPPFDNSSMDGYAIDAHDTSDASSDAPIVVVNFEKIMTGHPVPSRFNAVIPWEQTEETPDGILISRPVQAGSCIRATGEDVRAGATILAAGVRLEPLHIGVLASNGLTQVRCTRRARVAVLSTGNELVAPGESLGPGQVYDSNGPMLASLLRRLGFEVVAVARVRDDRAAITQWLREQAQGGADAIITTGGASVGEHDWLRTILAEDGELYVWRVALRPGKPFACGSVDGTPVFVLPGNPASVLACLHAFALPALRKMQSDQPLPNSRKATLTADVAPRDERVFLCPVVLDDTTAAPARSASSSVLTNHMHATAYALIPPGGSQSGDVVVVEEMY